MAFKKNPKQIPALPLQPIRKENKKEERLGTESNRPKDKTQKNYKIIF